MKFCNNCGTQMDDNIGFCPNCGAAQNAAPQNNFNGQPQQPYGQQPQQAQNGTNVGDKVNDVVNKVSGTAKNLVNDVKSGNSQNLLKVVIGGVAAVFALIIVIFFFRSVVGSGAMTAKGALKDYLKAQATCDAKDYVNATMSHKFLKAVKEEEDMSKSEIIDDLDDSFSDSDEYEIKDIKITKKKEMSDKKVENIEEYIEDETDVKVNISKVYTITYKYKYKSDDTDGWETMKDCTAVVYKQAGNWYVAAGYSSIISYASVDTSDIDDALDYLDDYLN